MDRLHSMRVFARVIDEGSFARAARELQLSAAVVTRLVADLEEHLRAKLIHRTTRKLSLTDTGELYLERVRQILTEVEDAEALAAAASARPRGHVRVLCSAEFAAHQLAPHLPQFRAANPQVTIELSASGAVEAVDANFDVSIISASRRPPDDSAVTRRLARSETIACASPDYLNRHGRPQHPHELLRHEVCVADLQREWVFHAATPEHAGPAGETVTFATPRAALSCSHTDTLYAAALVGLGIIALPSFVADSALRQQQLERVLPQWTLFDDSSIYAAMPHRKHVPARLRAFMDFLVQTFGGEDRDPWLAAAGCETQRGAPRESPQASLPFTP